MLDLYGTLNAGETLFEYLSGILKRRENKPAIDLLEVYALCLMLGFRGRYNSGSGEQVQSWREPMIEKITRYRGAGRFGRTVTLLVAGAQHRYPQRHRTV